MSIISDYYDDAKAQVDRLPTIRDEEANMVQPGDVTAEHLLNHILFWVRTDAALIDATLIDQIVTLARFQIISDMLAEEESL